jgi:hypothetical protein
MKKETYEKKRNDLKCVLFEKISAIRKESIISDEMLEDIIKTVLLTRKNKSRSYIADLNNLPFDEFRKNMEL